MIGNIFAVLGGLGLFLVGMAIMTDGLRQLAGDALRRALARFTTNPTMGAITGAVGTAILQSSSATTVMAVGFAGAGLLTFAQSLGIIFGANLGTTITGWLVALVGFKLDLGELALPLLFVAALMRLLGGPRIRSAGFALAGFGLVFAGISTLQVAMEGASDVLTPATFPPNTKTGRLQLVLIGMGITLVTQSSSAGVAAAITAVHVGAISLPQAAAMVIGMDIGTTFTAMLATIGGGINARRTGLAHVVYNLITAVGAFAILPHFLAAWVAFAPLVVRSDPEIALVSFHTFFNGLGVILALPLANQFARLIEVIVPSKGPQLTAPLDRTLLSHSSVAIDAVAATLTSIMREVSEVMARAIDDHDVSQGAFTRVLDRADVAIHETRQYLSEVAITGESAQVQERHVASLHVVDHERRLIRRGRMVERVDTLRTDTSFRSFVPRVGDAFRDTARSEALNENALKLELLWREIDEQIEDSRKLIIVEASQHSISMQIAMDRLDAVRWLQRIVHHAWRICHHLDACHQLSTVSKRSQDQSIE